MSCVHSDVTCTVLCGIMRSASMSHFFYVFFFFFNDTATTEIYTLSLHDALPILCQRERVNVYFMVVLLWTLCAQTRADRKSTRLNSSHEWISYAVFCLKKKKTAPLCDEPRQRTDTDFQRHR